MSALTFSLGVLLRNRTAVTLISIAYILSVLFFLGMRYGGIFDFGAFFAPLYYSDMAGIGDISRLISIRLLYLLLTVGLLGLAIARYPRLPQPGLGSRIGHLLAVVGLAGGAAIWLSIVESDRAAVERRRDLLATQIGHAELPAAQVTHYDLDLRLLEDGVPLTASARLRLKNPHRDALDTLLFTLNPGLSVQSVSDGGGRDLGYRVEGSSVLIDPARPLQTGDELALEMRYAGDIDRNGFDLLRDQARRRKWDGPVQKGDLTAWILEHSVHLPPRSRWYPVPGVDYGNVSARPVSFATARISIDAPAELDVVTQGAPEAIADAGAGRKSNVWRADTPVPALSLTASDYEIVRPRSVTCRSLSMSTPTTFRGSHSSTTPCPR